MKIFYKLGARFIMFMLLNEKIIDILILHIMHTFIFSHTFLVNLIYGRAFM